MTGLPRLPSQVPNGESGSILSVHNSHVGSTGRLVLHSAAGLIWNLAVCKTWLLPVLGQPKAITSWPGLAPCWGSVILLVRMSKTTLDASLICWFWEGS